MKENEEEEDEREWAALDKALDYHHHCQDGICLHATAAAAAGGGGGGREAAVADESVPWSPAFYLGSPVPACFPSPVPAEPVQEPPPPPLPIPPPVPASIVPLKEGGATKGGARGGRRGRAAVGGAAAAARKMTEDGGFLAWPSAVKKRPRGSCEVCYQTKAQCDNTFPCGRCVSKWREGCLVFPHSYLVLDFFLFN
jgi:hypothetical protein